MHPGDVIHVKTLDDASLTRDYNVPADGLVQFWKGGQYQVLSMTPQCLRGKIIQEYAQNLAHSADIDVTVGYRIGVSGAVKTPGIYNADATMSVADVVSLAGGVDADGDASKILLLRAGAARPQPLTAATTAVSTSIRSGDRIYVEQKSWVSRNVAPTVTAASAALFLLISALR